MDTPEIIHKYRVQYIIGISIFVSDFLIAWSSSSLGFKSMIFILAIIIGLKVEKSDDSIGVFGITLIFGSIISGAIMTIALAQTWISGGNPANFAIVFFAAPFLAVSGSTSLLNGFAITESGLISLIFAPILYFLAFTFVAIIGSIREYLRDGSEDTLEEKLLSSRFPKNVRKPCQDESERQIIVQDNDSTN